MKELILIDGNSLLNRAFYATKLFTTKSGVPTNAVFGFVKLLLKIIEDNKPDKLIVTFDLKAPTFRHKMYDQYKGTRKPMPEDLAVQIGMLKSLLRSMKICICEKERYEADDLIGTLSHYFENVHSVIFTGDRDAYQLVDERTDVYLTKTGVSNLLKLNADNFFDEIGYTPAQVIEMKSLMGDSSDNIPGVPGIGEKTALNLIQQYGSLDGVYEHITELKGAVRTKLETGRDSAYLSKKLATIDRNVPLDISEDECDIHMPFSQEVRDQFIQFEFASLLKLDIFEDSAIESEQCSEPSTELCIIHDIKSFTENFHPTVFASAFLNNSFHFYSTGKEYVVQEKVSLLDEGISASEMSELLSFVFSNRDSTVILYCKKDFQHLLHEHNVQLFCHAEDVSIMKYLVDFSPKDNNLSDVLLSYGLDSELPAAGLFALYSTLDQQLNNENLVSLYREVELPVSDVLFDMEIQGVKIDMKTFMQFDQRYHVKIDEITQKIYDAAGEQFNINSPKQLGIVLFEKMHLPAPKKSKSGSYSTSADILDKLAPDYQIVKDVLSCRHFQKLLSTYIDGFKPLIDPKTLLVHTTYNQTLTTTGRLSSANPNLQNIPIRDDEGKELRRLFVARDSGRILIDADYSQIELRLLAHFSGSKELIEAYRTGKDIHALTASQVFDVPLEEVTAQQRYAAKAVNFGIIYGMSEFGLATNLNIPNKQAGEYIRKYFERYSDVKKFMDDNVKFAKEHGYVTTFLGRKRMIPEINSSNFNLRSFGERAAMNMPLQGSSADIIKIAMKNVFNRLNKEGLRSKLILQVHDELVIDAYEEEKEAVADLLKFEMENAVHLSVPLTVEVKYGKSWYDAK